MYRHIVCLKAAASGENGAIFCSKKAVRADVGSQCCSYYTASDTKEQFVIYYLFYYM